jgi:hypothetical protein
MVVKYLKNLFKSGVRDNLSHRTIQAVRDNPSHLTNLHPIDRHDGRSKEKKILIQSKNTTSKQQQRPGRR